jgi:hypothetical protein
VRPTYLTPETGRQAAGPTWRSLRAPRQKELGSARRAPKESPPTLTRKRRSSPRPSADRGDGGGGGGGGSRRPSALWGRAGGRAGGARVQAVDRRNRLAADAAAAAEGAGTGAGRNPGAPRQGNGGRRSPAPLCAAPPATVRLALERGGEEWGDPPTVGLFSGSRCFRKLY